jgi:hypothetical protein
MILLEVIEQLAGHLQLVLLLVVSASDQHLKPLLLHLSQLELGHVCQQDGFTSLDLALDVGRVVDHPLDLYLELPVLEFCLDFL